MEEEGPINFKALRAKFQEDVLLAQYISRRPAVAEKPKYVPPPVVSGMTIAAENNSPVLSRVVFRDGLRASGGTRPNSFPPHLQQTSPSSQFANGDSTAKQSLKERHMPLVLPAFPVKEQKTDSPVAQLLHAQDPDSVKVAFSQNKIKKKGLLLPFKSTKASKVSAGNGEEPTYADLTTRPSSAPGELPSIKMQPTENGGSVQSDNSNVTECSQSSPDAPITPPSSETSVDSDNKFISTLERAKKKFSRRQMLISTKPKGFRSPDYAQAVNVFPFATNTESVSTDPPLMPPFGLPHMACISARPFFKAGNSLRKSPLTKNFGKDQAQPPSGRTIEPHSLSVPPKKPLPDPRSVGSLPAKPPRPPLVDLSLYGQPSAQELSPALSQAPTDEPDSKLPSISGVVLDPPKFPEFDNSEMKTTAGDAVDIASLELESLDLTSKDLPVPDFEAFESDLSACNHTEPRESSIIQDVNIGCKNIILLDPAGYPEPIYLPGFLEPPSAEQWSQSEEGAAELPFNSQTDEMYPSAAEFRSLPEESELSNHSELNSIQPHPNVYQQDSCYETCDNVYEVVDDINKVPSDQNSRKQKCGLKNPYADNHSKEETSLNKWQPNPWGSGLGDHSNNIFNHIQSKERQSPNIADFKEQRKREKHRIEKERKEQKEREKKENEMRKKFKVTGDEEPLYHAKVVVASKVRKNDLPVKSGDTVSIIRTTSCPKGKWLARDVNYKYGYISVMNVELNIKEMLELGKKAQAAGKGGNQEGDTISIDSRSSNHPVLTGSFTDDSEEWACEDETLSPTNESHSLPQQTSSMSELSCSHVGAQHTFSDANLEDLHTQNRHEALQKLAIFFQHTKDEFVDDAEAEGETPTNTETPNFLSTVEEPPYPEQEVDFNELELLPPPPLYADTF